MRWAHPFVSQPLDRFPRGVDAREWNQVLISQILTGPPFVLRVWVAFVILGSRAVFDFAIQPEPTAVMIACRRRSMRSINILCRAFLAARSPLPTGQKLVHVLYRVDLPTMWIRRAHRIPVVRCQSVAGLPFVSPLASKGSGTAVVPDATVLKMLNACRSQAGSSVDGKSTRRVNAALTNLLTGCLGPATP